MTHSKPIMVFPEHLDCKQIVIFPEDLGKLKIKSKCVFSVSVLELVVIYKNLNLLGNCNFIIFTTPTLSESDFPSEIKNLPFKSYLCYKSADVDFDMIEMFLNLKEKKEFEKRILILDNQGKLRPNKIQMTIGYTIIIDPLLAKCYRLIKTFIKFPLHPSALKYALRLPKFRFSLLKNLKSYILTSDQP